MVAASLSADIEDVAARMRRAKQIVYLTGAGLSVASGIPAYRSGDDAVWAHFITEWGTVAKFQEDPGLWWREFWQKAHGIRLEDKQPNAGHAALTRLLTRNPADVIVTQNIDGLHRRARTPEDQLVEIHGRHDRFLCMNPLCSAHKNPVGGVDVNAILDDGEIPECEICGQPLRPLVLLLDETYDSHPAYQMRIAKRSFNDSDVVVFVGTSFSVGITDYALRAALYAQATLVNVNLAAMNHGAFHQLTGKAEEILPALADAVVGPLQAGAV